MKIMSLFINVVFRKVDNDHISFLVTWLVLNSSAWTVAFLEQ